MNDLKRALRGFGWGHMSAGIALLVLAMVKFPTWMLALEVVVNSPNASSRDVAVVLWWPIARMMSLIQAIAGLTLLLGWKRAWIAMVGWACISIGVNLIRVPILG